MKNLIATLIIALGMPLTAEAASARDPLFAKRVIELTNQQRRIAHLPPLTEARELDRAAQDHAADQVKRGYFSHTTPEGITVSERVQKAGYDGIGGWENIYSGWGKSTASPEAAVDGWMKSPGHRANILNSRVEEIGVGVATDEQGKAVYVQNFGMTP
jgi:uncharacterized protein YkwD